MYSSVASNPTSSLDAASEMYSHVPSFRRRVILPVNRLATWSWKLPSTHPIQGVATQVSATKISNNCTTSLKKNLDTCGVSPSLLRILVNRRHTAHAFSRFLNTTIQS